MNRHIKKCFLKELKAHRGYSTPYEILVKLYMDVNGKVGYPYRSDVAFWAGISSADIRNLDRLYFNKNKILDIVPILFVKLFL